LKTATFDKKKFIDLYKTTVGSNIDSYDEREKYKYCFLMIFKDPVTRIYRGLEERVK
jgi:hypothetical protein